jgi:hypothetical protein
MIEYKNKERNKKEKEIYHNDRKPEKIGDKD